MNSTKQIFYAARSRARYARNRRLAAGRLIIFVNGSPALDSAGKKAALRATRASGLKGWRRIFVAVQYSLPSCNDKINSWRI